MNKRIFSIIALLCMSATLCLADYTKSNKYEDAQLYQVGNNSTRQHINEIHIDWVAGDINVQYGDQSSISWLEEQSNDVKNQNLQIHYLIKGYSLYIKFAASGKFNVKSSLKKNLTIILPRKTFYNELEINAVSSDMEVTVASKKIELQTVSGEISCKPVGISQEIEIESVSGNIELTLPPQAPFRLDQSSVSGKFTNGFKCTQLGESLLFGEDTGTETEIELQTVSGNITIQPKKF